MIREYSLLMKVVLYFDTYQLESLYKKKMGFPSQFCGEKHCYIQCQVIIVQEVATC